MENKIYYSVINNQKDKIRQIVLYYDNKVLAELECYNNLLGDWEEIDNFLEQEDLYEIYGDDVEFEEIKNK